MILSRLGMIETFSKGSVVHKQGLSDIHHFVKHNVYICICIISSMLGITCN